MPANLTPQYRAAEERFRQAVTPEEKLEALQEMLATLPKHKGTEKMQADIKPCGHGGRSPADDLGVGVGRPKSGG
jgi:hypothetical protein